MNTHPSTVAFLVFAVAWVALAPAATVEALEPNSRTAPARGPEFFEPELHISSSNVPLDSLAESLGNRDAWNRFLGAYGRDTQVYLDPRSGTPSSVVLHVPLIPGSGVGNVLRLEDLARRVGAPIEKIDEAVVAKLVVDFVRANRDAFAIDVAQLGSPRAVQVSDSLWQVSVPQQVAGIPVRHGRVVATISHGNLILIGTEAWGNVALDLAPRITGEQATRAGFAYAGGRRKSDSIWKKPRLEIVPFAPAGLQDGERFAGPIGKGYGHRLAWVFGFRREGEGAQWEVLVDARTGEMLAFEDRNQYEAKKISGGVYPLTSTEVCPSLERCGTMQSGVPMPFADTGLASPQEFANSAGIFDYPGSGTVTTRLDGKYVRVLDACGPVSESASGNIDLGGTNGQHDCDTAGTSPGDTPAARTAYYELNRIIEAARGWLPGNVWLTQPLQTNVNVAGTCNASYGSNTLSFYRSGGGCRNTGEIAGVFDHEWGHGLDEHDANASFSNPAEAYADIAAIYRLGTSCVGYGYHWTVDQGCGPTADGTGFNANESQTATPHCDLDCSGLRDADWNRHVGQVPDTPANFVCVSCAAGSGPCGRDVHCENAPAVQAAWDLVARDLRAAPFSMSAADAFIVGNRLFYRGSGNVGAWETCTCPATSNGCAAANGYMQWLAADDDNGNLADGTPHMTALNAAFARHGIACTTPTPVNSGCSGGPVSAPVLTATPGNSQAVLVWSAVAGAAKYRIFRSEGAAPCESAKALIAEVAGLGMIDGQVASGRSYGYAVQAVGASDSCFGPASSCVPVTPQSCAGSVVLDRAAYSCNGTIGITVSDADLLGTGTQSVSVRSGTEPSPEDVALIESPSGSGVFTGTIATASGPATHGDGQVSVADGDTVTVAYTDLSSCGTPNVAVTRIVSVDCLAPVISSVRAASVTGSTAEIRWDTNEPADGQVTYGATNPPGTVTPRNPSPVAAHATRLLGLQECTTYFYAVGSADVAGNAAFDGNGGAFYSFRTGKNVQPTYAYSGPPVTIPDDDAVQASIVVPDAKPIEDVTVEVRIAHGFIGDLVLTLVGPDGTRVTLSDQHGANGTGYTNTVFDDGAGTAIADGAPPFTGSFRPDQPLAGFDGKIALGTWKLEVQDVAAPDTGTIDGFDLTFTYAPQQCGPSLRREAHALIDTCGGVGGDGGVDPGEIISMPFTIRADGTAAVTGISATLSTITPGVLVTTASTTYPNLTVGASANGNNPFGFYVDPAVSCGTAIGFEVDLTANEGAWHESFSVPVGRPGALVATTNATDVPRSIPDNAAISSILVLTDPALVSDVDVSVDVAHTYDGDLVLTLVGPGGTRVALANRRGSSGDNFNNTVFNDEAATPISAGGPPFAGSFRPEQPLSVLDGIPAAGTWSLEVRDVAAGDIGTLVSWSLTLTTVGPTVCTACNVVAPPGEVGLLTWTNKSSAAWTSVPGAVYYELYRGEQAGLPSLLDASADSCLRTTTVSLSAGGLVETPDGNAFQWWIVRASNVAGEGPPGHASGGPRVHDSAGACP